MIYYVKVNPELSEALQKIAFRNGWKWSDKTGHPFTVSHTDKSFLEFDTDKKMIFWCCENEINVKKDSILDSLTKIMSLFTAKINDHSVTLNGDKITIDEKLTLTYDDVKQLYEYILF